MPIDSLVLRLMTELTRLTVQGQISWTVADPPSGLVIGTNDVVPLYCETLFKGQRIGLAQRRTKNYDGDSDSFYWTEQIVMMFVDPMQRVLWETTEEISALYNLFDVARNQAANVDSIFDRLLSRGPAAPE